MLQWMGGSRRKVTSSRKSTQKRQKQYFEQRKRQQQWHKASGFEGDNQAITQDEKKHRSLDILSLRNLSSNTNECSTFLDSDDQVADFPAFPNNSASTATPTFSSALSDDKCRVFDECLNASAQREAVGDWKITNEKGLSILGLIDGDQPDAHSGLTARQEAHVAFSVSGLGKVEQRTPVNSPPHLSSLQPTASWSPFKTNSTTFLLDDFGLEDVSLGMRIPPPSKPKRFPSSSMGGMDSSQNHQKMFSIAEDTMFCHSIKEKHLVNAKNVFDGDGRVEDKWNARYGFLQGSNLEDVECDGYWNNLLWQVDDKPSNQLKFGKHTKFSACGDPYGLDNWDGEMMMDRFDVLGSPSLRKGRLDDHDFITADKSRYLKFDQQMLSGFMAEDTKNNLGFFSSNDSEESCSSSAVRGDVSHGPRSNLKMWQRMRGHASDGDEQEGKPVSEIKETTLGTLLEAGHTGPSSDILHPDFPEINHACPFPKGREQPENRPLEANSSIKPGCCSCQTTKTTASCCTGNLCVLPVAELHIDAKLTLENISCSTPFQCCLGSTSEKIAFHASHSHILSNSSSVSATELQLYGEGLPQKHENAPTTLGLSTCDHGADDHPNISEFSAAYCKKAKVVTKTRMVHKMSELLDVEGFRFNPLEHPNKKGNGNSEAMNSISCTVGNGLGRSGGLEDRYGPG